MAPNSTTMTTMTVTETTETTTMTTTPEEDRLIAKLASSHSTTSSTSKNAVVDDDEGVGLVPPPATILSPQTSMEDVGQNRRLSRASIEFFQRETRDHQPPVVGGGGGLIGSDGKIRDDYIVKRQSVNKPMTSGKLMDTIPLLTDLTTAKSITTVDGWVLTQLLLSGYAKMSTKIDELNKINVFPIADGDTGANLKVCLKLPTRNLLLDPSDSVLVVASNMAADVLLNGQGNSGTILSHFFVSLAEEIKSMNKHELSVDEFATCLINTGKKMTDAVPNPVEGTLLSVSRDACTKLDAGVGAVEGNSSGFRPFDNLYELLMVWNHHAQTELAKTPEQLIVDGVKVLKKAGVVDSGAQGFVYCIEGMWDAVHDRLPEARDPKLFQTAKPSTEDVSFLNDDHNACDSKYQYCTEAVILLKDGATKEQVMEVIDECTNESCICSGCDGVLGDSVVCVGAPAKEGGDMVKLHIHTNEPQVFFDKIRPFSRDDVFKKEKVEDMYVMRETAHETHDDDNDYSDAKFTMMGMCSMLLPPSMQSDDLFTLPVFMVPSTTQEPIDIRYSTESEAIQALNQQRHPRTAIRYTSAASNPMQMKIELLAALAKGKPILVFIFSKDKKVSAFGRNVMQAVDMLEPEQKKMVKILCHGWGFYEASFLSIAMKMAKEGKTIDEAYEACQDHAARTFAFTSFVSSPTLHRQMKWRPGLFPPGFKIEDGSVTAFGVPAKVRSPDEIPEAVRVGKLMNLLGSANDLESSMIQEAQRIKDTLAPGQSIGDMYISCVGRPDYGHKFISLLKSTGVPIVGKPMVYNGGFITVATSSWGEFSVMYKIIEA